MPHTRFAIYYLPPPGDFADVGAAWLGWDAVRGAPVPQPDVPGLCDITARPRKYGFHGTLKPPFRLAEGVTRDDLAKGVAEMAVSCAPAQSDGLDVTPMGRILALTPRGDAAELARVAARCVRELDRFRAPLTDAELARRRQARLSQRQDALLRRWGYPYVLEEFRFHLTLTGRLPVDGIAAWVETLHGVLPDLPEPFVLDQVALVGERPDGFFEMIERFALVG